VSEDEGPAAATSGARGRWGSSPYAAWMRLALVEAARCAPSRDVPVGAVVVDETATVLGRGHNVRERDADPTGHAEVVALRQAGEARGSWRLDGCTLVVTMEPCVMCSGAAVAARLDRVAFGAFDDKAGACGSVWDIPRDRNGLHHPEIVAGVLEADCGAALSEFFHPRRLR